MALTIYKKDGTERVVTIGSSNVGAGKYAMPELEYSGTWMGECFVTVNIKSPVPIEFEIGDYLMYRGEKFVINYDPSVVKKAKKESTGDAFCYDNVKFNALLYELADMRMLDYVIGDNNIHYSGLPKFSVFCEDIDDFVDRLQVNADRYCEANGIIEAEKWIFVTPDATRTNARGDRASSAYSEAYPGGAYTDDERFRQNVSIDNMSVWDSMKYIKETFGLSFVVRGRTVIVASAAIQAEGVFEYGKGKGLYEIERVADSEQQIVTKLYAYGSSKNMPDRYYADMTGSPLPNNLAVDVLMLPGFPLMSLYAWVVKAANQGGGGGTAIDANAGKASITINGTTYTAYFSQDPYNPWIMSVNADDLGIREATKYFDGSDGTDDIFPTIENTGVDEVVRATVIEDNGVFADGAEIDNFKIYLPTLGFTLSDYITAEAVISMKDGFCGGREFPIVSATTVEENSTTLWEVECQRVKDDGTKLYYPYSDAAAHGETPSATEPYQVCAGDKYVLTGITMPATYINSSSVKLLEASLYFLSKNDTTRYTFVPKVDEIYMARQQQEVEEGEGDAYHDIIKEGDVVIFQDIDLLGDDGQGNPNALSITIDTLRIKEYGNASIPTYDITLRQEKQVGTIQRMQEQIGKIVSGETSVMAGGGGSVNIPVVRQLIETYGANYFLKRNADDSTTGWLKFLANGGIKFGDRNSWYINHDGEAVLSNINVQNLNALNAHFAQLIIDEIKSVGGMVIISPSNAKIHKVEIIGAGGRSESYRIYFKATDGDRKVYQSFMERDQIVCAQFNAAASGYTLEDVSNKFYWRRVWRTSTPTSPITVDGVACHWIDVYTQGYCLGSGVPQVGDEIAVLGNDGTSADQLKRQNAIVISAYDIDWLDTGHGNSGDQDYVPKLRAPFIVQYTGINDFTLYNKRQNVMSYGLNEFKGKFIASGGDLQEQFNNVQQGIKPWTHQVWADEVTEVTSGGVRTGWSITGFSKIYTSGKHWFCLLTDYTEGEGHLSENYFTGADVTWMPFNTTINGVAYKYLLTQSDTQPSDNDFNTNGWDSIEGHAMTKGWYLWTRETITYGNGQVVSTYTPARIGDDGAQGQEGVSSYLHLAYASSADGSEGFSTTYFEGAGYMGIKRDEDPDDPSGASAYTQYTWARILGDDGLSGLSTPPPYTETITHHYLAWNTSTGVTKSTGTWSTTYPDLTGANRYLWQYDEYTYTPVDGVRNLLEDSTNQWSYYPASANNQYFAKIKFAEQLTNGQTYSLVFKTDDLSTFGITTVDIDIYFKTTWKPSGAPSSSRHIIQAKDLTPEEDGTYRVTFTAICDVASNTQLGLYFTGNGLGTNPAAYPELYWAMLTEGGVQYNWMAAPVDLAHETAVTLMGASGRGIASVTEQYAYSTSSSSVTGSWGTSPLTPTSSNPYVWNREVITYSDSTSSTSDAHLMLTWSLVVKSQVIKYAVTSSSSQPADSSFSTYANNTPPTVNIGQYLWTMTETTYGDNTTSKSYSVSYKGTNGADGRGVTGVAIAYQEGTSGTTPPTGTWTTNVPAVTLGNYLWTRTTMSFTTGSNTVSYSVSRIGTDGSDGQPGAPGQDGQPLIFHQAYANSADGVNNFSTTPFEGATYYGTCSDLNTADPTTPSSYEWVELKALDTSGMYVSAVRNYYKVHSEKTGLTPLPEHGGSTTGWVEVPPGTMPVTTQENPYLWNYEVTEYGSQTPNLVLKSKKYDEGATLGTDPYLFPFDLSETLVSGQDYSFVMKIDNFPSDATTTKTNYRIMAVGKSSTSSSTTRRKSQMVGQDPNNRAYLVPDANGIIKGTFTCDLNYSSTETIVNANKIVVSMYPSGGTYTAPVLHYISVVKGKAPAAYSPAPADMTVVTTPHPVNGDKGESPWMADLSNEMDSISCDDTGYAVSQQSVTTTIGLYHGQTAENFGNPTVKRNGTTLTLGTASNGVTATYSSKVLTITYATTAKITGKDIFEITITSSTDNTVTNTLTFTVNGMVGDVYNLLPSVDTIKAERDDSGNYVVNGASTFTITCGYTTTINGVVTTQSTDVDAQIDGKYNIFYRKRTRSTGAWQGTYYRYYTHKNSSTVARKLTDFSLNTYDAVEFIICTSTASTFTDTNIGNYTVIDRENVYVVADGLKGDKADFVSTVFKRTNTTPTTPTGGSYSSPVPSGWEDGIPSGTAIVWASHRKFTFDGTGDDPSWSTPTPMTDTATQDIEFAKVQAGDVTPATPTDANRHGGSGTQIWFDPALDPSEDYTQMAWMAQRECKNGVWGDWTILRIKGEEGAGIKGATLTRDTFTAANWETYISRNTPDGSLTGWNDTDGMIAANCRIGDIFIVEGTATDTGDYYTMYECLHHISSNKYYGYTIAHTIGKVGADGTSVTITGTDTRYVVPTTNPLTKPSESAFNNGSTTFPSVSEGDVVWSRTTVTYSGGTTTKTYGMSKVGADGENGTPGAPGADGRTTYLHLAYCKTSDNSDNSFSTTYFDGAKYIGTCTDFNSADPTTFASYEWKIFVGDTGASITDAVLVREGSTYTDAWWETKIATTTEVTWTNAQVVIEKCRVGDIFAVQGDSYQTGNHYVLYYKYTGKSGTSAKGTYYSHTVSYKGNGIASETEYYLISALSEGVYTDTPGWSTTQPTPTLEKPYLWNYEVTTYTDGTTHSTLPHVLYHMTQSAAGNAYMLPPTNYYLASASNAGITRNTSGWTTDPTSAAAQTTTTKRYLWNYEAVTWSAPMEGRNLLMLPSSTATYARFPFATNMVPANGVTVTVSAKLTVPENYHYAKVMIYGKNSGGTSTYSTQATQAAEAGQHVLSWTFAFNPASYTDITQVRMYYSTALSSGLAQASVSSVEWCKLEIGSAPTVYSVAPETLASYTDPHIISVHGADGDDAETYVLQPVANGEKFVMSYNTNTSKYIVTAALDYKVMHIVGASASEMTSGVTIRWKYDNYPDASLSNLAYDSTNAKWTNYDTASSKYPTTNYSSTGMLSQTHHVTVELLLGSETNPRDIRNVPLQFAAQAVSEIDESGRYIRDIVIGTGYEGGSMVSHLSSVEQQADRIESTVNTISSNYVSQSTLTQTADSINSRVVHLVGTANLLIASKNPQSGFDSSLSTASVQEQTNKYFACFNFGNTKPGNGDTFIVSWKQTSVSGYNYRVMLYGKMPNDTYGTFLSSGNVGMETGTNGIYAYKFTVTASYVVEKVVIYTSKADPVPLFTPVEWAKAEFCASDAVASNRTAWNLAIEETGSTIEQTADNIIMQVEGTGIDINNQRIRLNGDTQINGTLQLDDTGDGFMLLSGENKTLITPGTIGSFSNFKETTYINTPFGYQVANEFYKEDTYYRTGMYSATRSLGEFESGSSIQIAGLSLAHYLIEDSYARLYGVEDGTVKFFENGTEMLSVAISSGTTYSYTTSTNGASVSIEVRGMFKVRSGQSGNEAASYTRMDALKTGSVLTTIACTIGTPAKGMYVRIAADGIGIKTGNGKSAYFGPDGFRISPLLHNVYTMSSSYTATFSDDLIIVNNSSTITLTLPTDGSIPAGKMIYVKKLTSSNTLRVQALYSSSGRLYKCNSATAVAYEDTVNPVMMYYISFDSGSGVIGWLQGYCG